MTTADGHVPAWLQREHRWVGRIATLQQRLRDGLATETPERVVEALRSGDLSAALTELTAFCAAHAPVDGSSTDYAAWDRMLVDLQDLAGEVFAHELDLLAERLKDSDEALELLRLCATSNDLLDEVCERLVLHSGFGRIVLSRVDSGLWRPWMITGGDETWFSEWVDREIPLDGLVVESRILERRLPELVYDTQTADVYRPIIVDTGHSTSYAVAPVIVSDVVIGFLHADYHPTGRRVRDVDRDVLWAYALGFAQLYERAVLRERLVEQRQRVREALAASDEFLADRGGGLTLSADAPAETAVTTGLEPQPLEAGGSQGLTYLTERERQVLALVAVGATNAQIADQLVVAESTVKTHVKHILRKLGVSNRAQAISRYLAD